MAGGKGGPCVFPMESGKSVELFTEIEFRSCPTGKVFDKVSTQTRKSDGREEEKARISPERVAVAKNNKEQEPPDKVAC